MIDQNGFLRIHYKIACTDCVGYRVAVRGEQRRDLPIFEISSLVDGKAGDHEIDQLLKNYWERKIHRCKISEKLLVVTRTFQVPNPMILAFSLSNMNTQLNPIS